MTQHVLFIVTNAAIIGPHNRKTGFFFAEVAHPFAVLDEAGIAVEFASVAADGHPMTPTTKRMRHRRSFSKARLSAVSIGAASYRRSMLRTMTPF